MAALEHPDIHRLAILDFDVHHGNGTVDIFKDIAEVLVCSSFQHPFYPNRQTEVNRQNIVDTPLSAGTDGKSFRRAIEQNWLGALEQHKPDLIFISAGFASRPTSRTSYGSPLAARIAAMRASERSDVAAI